MAEGKTENQNGVTAAQLERALKPIALSLAQLEKVVKMSISEQRRINSGLENDFEKHEKKDREDVQLLWDGIKKNTDRISSVNNRVAYLTGAFTIIAGGSIITKLFGLW